MRGYDEWKTRSSDDQYAMDHPEKYRHGVYTVTIERTITATVTVEVEASSEDDAYWDAVLEARKVPFDNWKVEQDDYETTNVEGRPSAIPTTHATRK